MKRVTILIPFYNEEDCLPSFYLRLKSVLAPFDHKYDFEFLFTNNASTDASLDLIRSFRAEDPRVQIITFSRNFGYQSSILGGLHHARGDAVVIIDADGEDPPEMIPQFLEKWEEGYELVYGIRGKRPEPRWLTSLRNGFYRILKAVADSDIIANMAEFSLFSKRVRDEILRNKNTFPFLRAEIAYSGFRKFGIEYDRQPRLAGASKYNLMRMVFFAVSGILSISTFPLRFFVYFWPFLVLANAAVFTYAALDSNIVAISGLIIVDILYLAANVGLLGIYAARIYKNGISRPVYIVDWSQSWLNDDDPQTQPA